MSNEKPVKRTGKEVDLREGLRDVDRKVGQRPIRDDSYSGKRHERQRGKFVDLHADEDGDPTDGEWDNEDNSTNNQPKRKPSRLKNMRDRLLKKVKAKR